MIACQGVSYHYERTKKGIENVEFDTSEGNIIGIIGENGAGKSTLFKCLLGLYKPQLGQITYKDKPISYSRKGLVELRQHVNMVLQDPERQLFYNGIFDEIAMGPRNIGKPETEVKQIVDQCIKMIHGEDFFKTPVQYLSFGQKKRVSLAGILALSCDVLLLDEPETGLDPMMQREMITIIRQLAEEGKKVILSSHNMELIYDVCDTVYVMHQGTIISKGPTDEIMEQTQIMKKAGLERPLMIKAAEAMGIKPHTLAMKMKTVNNKEPIDTEEKS